MFSNKNRTCTLSTLSPTPVTWLEQNQVRQVATLYTMVWTVILAVLNVRILMRHRKLE